MKKISAVNNNTQFIDVYQGATIDACFDIKFPEMTPEEEEGLVFVRKEEKEMVDAFQAISIDACKILAGKDWDELGPVLTPEEEEALKNITNDQFVDACQAGIIDAAKTKEEEVTMENAITAAAEEILCAKIAHTEEIDGKVYLAASRFYENDEVLIWDGRRAEISHPFSDKESKDVTAEFFRYLEEAKRLNELPDESLVWKLASFVIEEAAASLVGCEEAYEGPAITLVLSLIEARGFTQRELNPLVMVAEDVGEQVLPYSAIGAEVESLLFTRGLDW